MGEKAPVLRSPHALQAGGQIAVVGTELFIEDEFYVHEHMSFDIAVRCAAHYICPRMLKKTTKLYEILYVSTLAPEAPISVVADIAGKARQVNAELGVTGLLIFDGMRFCQQLEGNQKEVLKLLERIRQDTRHVQMEVLHHGELAERRFRRFSLGYASVGDGDALGRLEELDTQVALDAFLALLPTLDLDA